MKRTKIGNRILSAVVAAGMAVSLCPVSAFAEREVSQEGEQYVLMNIPYDEFYAADVENDVKVDAFTSATKSKTRTGNLAGGSYHVNADGSDITGVTFPVKLPEDADLSSYKEVKDTDKIEITVTNRGQTKTTVYEGKDALFENPTYSYYVLSSTPSYYKELSVGEDGKLSFGKTVGTSQTIENVSSNFTTETTYGDYQLDLEEEALAAYFDHDTDQIYGVIVSTKEGNDYGLRHLENIWLGTKLSWATGFTEAVHNCPTSSTHYENMMGQTINKVTYYTSKGIFEIPLDEIYVPIKFAHTATVADAAAAAGETTVTVTGFPDDYNARYKVDGIENAAVTDGKLIFSNVKQGQYTLTISDSNKKYADVTTDFTLYTETMPAAYNNNGVSPALVASTGASQNELADYISNITSDFVNGTKYAASGRGSVVIVKKDGTIDTTVAPFATGETFEIVVTATGYKNPLTFTYVKKQGQTVEPDKDKTDKNETDKTGNNGTNNDSDKKKAPEKGASLTSGNVTYKVTKVNEEVAYASSGSASGKATIPATVTIDGITYKITSIASGAFKNNKKITSVTIGKNVTEIGANAFSGCTKLKSVTIGAGVKKIGKQAFQGDKKLSMIKITSTKLSSVGKNAFKGIGKTAKIKVPKKKLASYKKILKGKGQGKKVKISK